MDSWDFGAWVQSVGSAASQVGTAVADFALQRNQIELTKIQSQAQIDMARANANAAAAMTAQPTYPGAYADVPPSGLPAYMFGIPTNTLLTLGAIVMAYKVLK